MLVDNVIVKCSGCSAKNRIPRSRVSEKPRCGKCRSPLVVNGLYPEYPVTVSDASFSEEILRFPGAAAVFFWSPSCGYCQRMMPTLDRTASRNAGNIKFAKLILEQNPSTSSRYRVQSVPTLILFKRGQEVHRITGALSQEELQKHLRILL